jgi:mono/diheme cytochrome c family protein
MREKIRRYKATSMLLAPFILGAALAVLQPALSQEQAKVTARKAPVRQTSEVSGAELFHSYCASCHGQNGKGDGPAAPALKAAPPDLTLLTKKNGGQFPADHLMNVLANESDYPVHGSKDMPVWGPIFRKMGADQTLGRLRAHNVTDYLKSIQEK